MTTPPSEGPLVSVIIIFHDAGQFIEEAIESVVTQTWPHWELLLVDDGSRDASRQVAERYRQRIPDQVRILQHPGGTNQGMSVSRNLGLAAARGDFVAFLDADDVYLPQRLERHVRQFGQYPEAGAVQSCVEYWHSWAGGTRAKRDVPGQPPPVRLGTPIKPPELLLLLLESRGATVAGICGITVRRSLLQALGGSEVAFRIHYEDQALFSKLYLSTDVVVTGETLAKYRQHGASATGRNRDSGIHDPHAWHEGRGAFLEWLEKWLNEHGIEDPEVRASVRLAQREHRKQESRGLRRMLRATAHKLADVLLPAAVETWLTDWWGARKLAFSRQRAVRASTRIARRSGAGTNPVDGSDRDRGGS
jgi:glycosyltransferase involved in cell wall biosynthesis